MKFFKKNKKILFILLPVLLISVFLLFPGSVSASVGTVVATVLGWILYPIIWLLGKLVVLFITVLIGIFQYNDFIDSNAVSFGWTLVRDFCNMFFILILLIIAFATILRIESYNLKTWLPKLLLMAVLINFSKLICGIFIDVAQVIMLTFVNAFKGLAGANLTEMLGISKILSFDASNTGDVTGWSILGSVILALVFSGIAAIVILSMLVMLAMRTIMIWIYIVLSPLAYLLASFPQGQSYSQKWWTDFSKNLIIGPVLAFFVWLSFASLGGVEGQKDVTKMKHPTYDDQANELVGAEGSVGLTEAGSYDHMIKFVISIGMLLGGMMIAQEMGGMAGKALGKVSGKLNAAAIKRVKRITGVDRAQRAIQTYQQQKDTKREDLAQKDAGRIATAVGTTKKFVTTPFRAAVKGAGNLIKGIPGVDASDSQLKAREDEIAQKQKKKKESQESLTQLNKEAEDIEKNKELLLNVQGDIDLLNQNRGTMTDDEIREAEANIIHDYNRATGDNVAGLADASAGLPGKITDMDEDLSAKRTGIADADKSISDLSAEITSDEQDLNKKRKRARNIDRVAPVLAGVIAGGILGGVGGAISGAIIGGGAVEARKRIVHAGEEDLALASNFRSSQISKHKESLKDEKTSDLEKTINDYKLPADERAAATMILMERGSLSKEKAELRRDEIKSTFGGDNKVMNQLDSALNKNYQSLTKNFTDLNDGQRPNETATEHQERVDKAREKIVKGVVEGTIKLENVDEDSMDLIMPKLIDTLSNKNFKGIYDNLTKDKQREVESSLRTTGSYSSLKKLATIQDSNLNSFQNDDDKVRFLGEIEINEVKKLTGGDRFITAKRFMSSSTNPEIANLRNNSRDDIDFVNNLNRILKKSKLSLRVPAERAVINAFKEMTGVRFPAKKR